MANQRDPLRSPDRCIHLVTVISVVLLAVIAAAVSFGHMRELALRHGEARWSGTLIPLSVDGMVVTALMSVLLATGDRTGVVRGQSRSCKGPGGRVYHRVHGCPATDPRRIPLLQVGGLRGRSGAVRSAGLAWP
ncbi:DUF2637 domain-containing protein [Actinomadura scrupuli]|uniref:DUF2637 domain-containing protein n=1 Tax=Actinomadura scrupuli TaxID=559629 RepID=UPI003D98132C